MSTPAVVVSLINEGQEFQRMQASDAKKAAASLGIAVEVVFAEGHSVVQVQQLFKFIHAADGERPRAIVVETVSGEGLERVAKNAAAANIGWIVINRNVTYLEPLREAHRALIVAGLGVDNLEVGRIQARQCRRLRPAGGRIVVVQGPADTSAARLRLNGLQESITNKYDVRVLTGDWTEGSGEKAMSAWLRLKTNESFAPDIVVAQNDSMAIGARRAIMAMKGDWRQVAYLGCDGLPAQGVRLVDAHELAGTVVTPTTTGPALQMVSRWLASGAIPPLETLLPPKPYPAH